MTNNTQLNDTQKSAIIKMRDKFDISFADISAILDCGSEQAKKFYQRCKLNSILPPKTIIKKSLTNGRIGIEIKRIIQENGKTPYRKIPEILKEKFGNETPIPSASREIFTLKQLGTQGSIKEGICQS
jgi:hypothetical protein